MYIFFFNLIFKTGTLPESWLECIIKPIYKKKVEFLQQDNYCPITILSCFGKLVTVVLNLRLNTIINAHEVLAENQTGFREGSSILKRGGWVLSFFSAYVGLGLVSTVHPKKIKNFKHPPKLFEMLATPKNIPLSVP